MQRSASTSPRAPYAFVTVRGRVEVSEDLEEVFRWALPIARRYMGDELAESFARRTAVAGELLVRLHAEHLVAMDELIA